MVKQGDIIKIDFNPRTGHEQSGYRPAVVVSNDIFNTKTNLAIVCPITNTTKPFPLHVALDGRTTTTGVIMCEHIKAVDISARDHKTIEHLPKDLLDEVVAIVHSEIAPIHFSAR